MQALEASTWSTPMMKKITILLTYLCPVRVGGERAHRYLWMIKENEGEEGKTRGMLEFISLESRETLSTETE